MLDLTLEDEINLGIKPRFEIDSPIGVSQSQPPLPPAIELASIEIEPLPAIKFFSVMGEQAIRYVERKKGSAFNSDDAQDRHDIKIALEAFQKPFDSKHLSHEQFKEKLLVTNDHSKYEAKNADAEKLMMRPIYALGKIIDPLEFHAFFQGIYKFYSNDIEDAQEARYGVSKRTALSGAPKGFYDKRENIIFTLGLDNLYPDARNELKDKLRQLDGKTLVSEIKTLSRNEAQKLHKSLNELGIRIDETHPLIKELSESFKKMEDVFVERPEEILKRSIQDRLETLHQGGTEFTQIGYILKNKNIVNFGQGVICTAKFFGNLDKIIESPVLKDFILNSSLMKGLAGFTPYLGAAAAGLTLFSLLSSKKSPGEQQQIQAILAQIFNLQMEMRQNFQEVIKRLGRIEDGILDIKSLLITGFTSIERELRRQDAINMKQFKAVYLQKFKMLLFSVKELIEYEDSKNLEKDCLTNLKKLRLWLLDESCSANLNGNIFLNNPSIKEPAKWLVTVLTRDAQSSLLGYLGSYAKILLFENKKLFPENIEPKSFFNLTIWTQALQAYFSLFNFARLKGFANEKIHKNVISKIKVQADNLLCFFQYLRESPDLYNILFGRYQTAMDEINKLIRLRFDETRNNEVNARSFAITRYQDIFKLNDFIPETHPLRKLLESHLNEIDASYMLLQSYFSLAGLPEEKIKELPENLPDSKSLLETKTNRYLTYASLKGWGNQYRSPEYYKTLKTKVLTVDGQQRLYALMRTHDKLELYGYDYGENQWQALSTNTESTWQLSYFKDKRFLATFALEVMEIDKQEKLVAMMWTPKCLELHAYDPKLNQWGRLPNGPQWNWNNQNYFNYFCLPSDVDRSQPPHNNPEYINSFRTAVINIAGEQYLLAIIRSQAGLELYAFNQQTHWITLASKPLHESQYREVSSCWTLNAHVVHGTQSQMLVVIIYNGNGCDAYECAFTTNENQLKAHWSGVMTCNDIRLAQLKEPQYYKTFNSNVITLSTGQQRIMMMMRIPKDGGNLLPFEYNPATKNFSICEREIYIPMVTTSDSRPVFSDPNFYETVRTIPIHFNGSDKLLVIFRGLGIDNNFTGHLEHYVYDHESPHGWINTGQLSASKDNINLTPHRGAILHGHYYINDSDTLPSRALQYNLLEAEGERQLIGLTFCKEFPMESFKYVLTPRQLALGDDVRKNFVETLMQSLQKSSTSKIEQHIRGLLNLIELLKVEPSYVPDIVESSNYADNKQPTIAISPTVGQVLSNNPMTIFQHRLNVLSKQINPTNAPQAWDEQRNISLIELTPKNC